MRHPLLTFLLLIWALCAQAEPARMCFVCDKVIPLGPAWLYEQTNYVCPTCHKLETICCICGLPAGPGSIHTQDGRYVCRRDVKGAILTEEQALSVFEDTREKLDRIFYGEMALRSPVVVKLFDIDYWNSQPGAPTANSMRRPGFSLSRLTGRDCVHNVGLQSALNNLEFGAVCAHEYTHLWINENCPSAHKIEANTLEAICELVSYKLLLYRNDQPRIARLKKNPYTNGKILTLIAYENLHGMSAILQWVKTGTTDNLDNFDEVALPKTILPVTSYYAPIPDAAPHLPKELMLEGLLGTSKKRLALINGQSFEINEERTIHLEDKTLHIQCLDIQKSSVILRVDGTEKPITLSINGK